MSEEANMTESAKLSHDVFTKAIRHMLAPAVKNEPLDEHEIKAFARNTMNELLGLYGYDHVDETEMPCKLSGGAKSNDVVAGRVAASQLKRKRKHLPTRDQKGRGVHLTEQPETLSRSSLCETGSSTRGSPIPRTSQAHVFAASTQPAAATALNRSPQQLSMCEWCQKPGQAAFIFREKEDARRLCSEKCFAAFRRDKFKRLREGNNIASKSATTSATHPQESSHARCSSSAPAQRAFPIHQPVGSSHSRSPRLPESRGFPSPGFNSANVLQKVATVKPTTPRPPKDTETPVEKDMQMFRMTCSVSTSSAASTSPCGKLEEEKDIAQPSSSKKLSPPQIALSPQPQSSSSSLSKSSASSTSPIAQKQYSEAAEEDESRFVLEPPRFPMLSHSQNAILFQPHANLQPIDFPSRSTIHLPSRTVVNSHHSNALHRDAGAQVIAGCGQNRSSLHQHRQETYQEDKVYNNCSCTSRPTLLHSVHAPPKPASSQALSSLELLCELADQLAALRSTDHQRTCCHRTHLDATQAKRCHTSNESHLPDCGRCSATAGSEHCSRDSVHETKPCHEKPSQLILPWFIPIPIPIPILLPLILPATDEVSNSRSTLSPDNKSNTSQRLGKNAENHPCHQADTKISDSKHISSSRKRSSRESYEEDQMGVVDLSVRKTKRYE